MYWILQFTWGLIVNIFGGLIALILIIFRKKPHIHKRMIYFRVGENWGGFNIGLVSLVSKSSSEFTLNHEYGHCIQNAMFGVLYPFLVMIPSVTRYHYRNWLYKHKRQKYYKQPDYYSIWFEKQANKLGSKWRWENEKHT